MSLKFPGIPDPTGTPQSQLATLQALKQVVELLAANATGKGGSQGVGTGSQIFALQDEVKRQIAATKAILGDKIDKTAEDSKWTVEDARSSLIADISESREQAIKARTYAKTILDDFENGTFLQTITDINASVDDTKAAVKTEAGARATADSAMAGRVDNIISTFGSDDASYKNAVVTFANKTNAVSQGYEKFAASNGWSGSNIENWTVALTGPTGAIATQVNSLKAEVLGTKADGSVDPSQGKLSSYLLNELNLVADQNKKIATGQQLQNLISQTTDPNNKNSLQAQVTTEAQTRASFQGKVTSRYMVAASASGNGVTAISGLELISDASSNVPISEFNVTADKFNLYHPSYGKKAVMSVQSINGTPTLAIAGDIVADGTIKARHMAFDSVTANSIKAGSINADKIQASSITGDKIAANTIAATNIAAGAITADKIQAGTITADRLVVGGIDFSQIKAGGLSSASVSSGYGFASASVTVKAGGTLIAVACFDGMPNSPASGGFAMTINGANAGYVNLTGVPDGSGIQYGSTSGFLWAGNISGADKTYNPFIAFLPTGSKFMLPASLTWSSPIYSDGSITGQCATSNGVGGTVRISLMAVYR